jgi:hypothetical protein
MIFKSIIIVLVITISLLANHNVCGYEAIESKHQPNSLNLWSDIAGAATSVGRAIYSETSYVLNNLNVYSDLQTCALDAIDADTKQEALIQCAATFGKDAVKTVANQVLGGSASFQALYVNYRLQCYSINYGTNSPTTAIYDFSQTSNIYPGMQLFVARNQALTQKNNVDSNPAFLFSNSQLSYFESQGSSFLSNLYPSTTHVTLTVNGGTMNSNGHDLLFNNLYQLSSDCPGGHCYAPAGWVVCVPIKDINSMSISANSIVQPTNPPSSGGDGGGSCVELPDNYCDLFHEFRSGNCWEITVQDGRSFCASPDHLVMKDQWVLTRELKVGDELSDSVISKIRIRKSHKLSSCINGRYEFELDKFKFASMPLITPGDMVNIPHQLVKLLKWVFN